MQEQDYHSYISAFNARDYAMLETFFADDFVLENAGFRVEGKAAFRQFYAFFHEYCEEEVVFKGFYRGKEKAGPEGFVANVVIRFTGIKDLSAEVLEAKGYQGMSVVPKGVTVDVEFLILYQLNAAGQIQYIKGAVWEPARP